MMSVQGICDTQVSSYHAAREASTRPSQLIILFPNATIKRERFRGIMLKVFCVKAIFPRLLVRLPLFSFYNSFMEISTDHLYKIMYGILIESSNILLQFPNISFIE